MGQAPSPGEWHLVERLRSGDERAFTTLIDSHHASLLRLARIYVGNPAVAEEVVQETWLGVLQGLAGFEGRSSLRTWIFRILTNRAKTRAEREGRHIPFAALSNPGADPSESAVEPDRFLPATHPTEPGHWARPPQSWGESPERQLLSQEACSHIQRAINNLPAGQREVITLRDIEQWTSEEVCNVLGISETNQRVLLHRARSKMRRALEDYFGRKAGGWH
jgi:RNA polymerase sigma-70 factor (ECF subfamily)